MSSTGLPDPSYSRFFVALIPSVEVQEYANQVIRELGDRYRTRTSKAPPHITLQPPFLWQPETVADLENCLKRVAQEHPPVPLMLSGFGAFAPRVLYMNVLKTPELLTLQTHLMARLEAQLGIVDPVSKRRPFSPHLTVASRNLTRRTFNQAWAELSQQPVAFECVVDRLTLLIHNGQRWQIQSEFPLMTQPDDLC